ncbi:MAG: hypothetical protein CM15mP74_14080 [Halieaceae bacterium]|nr:MAG: hypothetical protein CM15mP74_14080 [Halieaceae bacterium]
MLLAVTACSATQFIYNRVDILVRWYLDDYVSLDRDQRARFDQRLEVFLEWHRSEELPSYVVLLDESLAILDDGVPLQAAREMSDRIEEAAIRFRTPSWSSCSILAKICAQSSEPSLSKTSLPSRRNLNPTGWRAQIVSIGMIWKRVSTNN